MIDLSKGMNFNAYLNKCSEDNREKLLNTYENTQLSDNVREAVKDLKEKVNVVVFSEDYCPDCIVTLPFIKRMQESNENIKVYYYGLNGNRELLEQYTGTSRIPTIMTFSDAMEPKGAYIEVPEEIAEKVAIAPSDKKKEIIQEYRHGRYNSLIEKNLLSIIKR